MPCMLSCVILLEKIVRFMCTIFFLCIKWILILRNVDTNGDVNNILDDRNDEKKMNFATKYSSIRSYNRLHYIT